MKTTFRKMAPFIWSDSMDPSTYGEIDLDLTAFEKIKSDQKITLMALLLKALTEGYKAVPQINSYVKCRKVQAREEFSISLMVPHKQEDLCFATFRELETLDLSALTQNVQKELEQIKTAQGVQQFEKIFSIIDILPRWLLRILVPLLEWVLIRDYFKIPWLPRRPFGSIIISNIGSLGFQRGFLPLVNFTKASLMVALGQTQERPVVIQGKLEVRKMVTVGFNLDHRIMDGFHAQKFIVAFKNVFENPQDF